MRYAVLYGAITLLILFKLSFAPLFQHSTRELGSKDNPIKIMLTPSVEAEKVTASADALVDYLHKKTGLFYTASIPTSFIIVVESFGSNGVDIAITNTFSYVLARDKYGAEAEMMVLRRGGEKSYKGQIITRVDSGIDSLNQLSGKKFAFVDAASTSGYILPKALLETQKIKPSETVFGSKHDNVVMMVYQKQVDAGATYYSAPDPKTKEPLDARIRVLKQFPDVFEKVKILGLTEAIPNDPIVFRKDVPRKTRDLIKQALLDFQSTPQGKKVLFETYAVEGLAPAMDSDYNSLRELIAKHGGDLNKALQKK